MRPALAPALAKADTPPAESDPPSHVMQMISSNSRVPMMEMVAEAEAEDEADAEAEACRLRVTVLTTAPGMR